MTPLIWHYGPPRHVGWWNASISGVPDVWRWWDGYQWSLDCWPTTADVGYRAAQHESSENARLIAWSDYWPENARVPRADPGKEK